MSIKSTLAGFFSSDAKEKFESKPHDPVKARKPLLSGIERTREQFKLRSNAGASKAPNKWWQVKNDVVALTVKVNGDTFDINGVATNHMPDDRFLEFLDKFEEAVNAGEFDEELANKGNGDAKVRIKPARSASKRAAGDQHPSTDRKGWDKLTRAEKQKVSAFYRFGKNPDGSVISEVGYKPDAPLAS